ncbi:MAG: hypothetical protein ACQEQI_08775 [Bacillota bacterium]
MKAILNNKDLSNQKVETTDLESLVSDIRDDLTDEIIDQIYVDGQEVTEDELINNYNAEEISEVKFITKKSINLVKETLEEANDYLPRLQQGIIDVADLFLAGEIATGNDKFQLCLNGIEWYSDVLTQILSLIYQDKVEVTEIEKLEEFNEIINRVLVEMQEDNLEEVAELLNSEVIDYIDEFIILNDQLLSKLK